jgi:DNA-binding NarL/FixJ family response regulator
MKCKFCGGASRILAIDGRERLRECVECVRRWRSVELLQGFSLTALPATAESVFELKATGKTIREIGEALHMSTRTVQQHLASAPTIQEVWR